MTVEVEAEAEAAVEDVEEVSMMIAEVGGEIAAGVGAEVEEGACLRDVALLLTGVEVEDAPLLLLDAELPSPALLLLVVLSSAVPLNVHLLVVGIALHLQLLLVVGVIEIVVAHLLVNVEYPEALLLHVLRVGLVLDLGLPLEATENVGEVLVLPDEEGAPRDPLPVVTVPVEMVKT